MPNEEFSQDFADAKHGGEESEDNYKILWEDEFQFTGDIKSVELTKESTYLLCGEKDGEAFEFPVKNMKIWKIKGDNENQIALSENVIGKESIQAELGVFEITFKEKSVITNIIPGVYIDVKDFPKELIS